VTVSAGASPFSCTGRAVSVRRGEVVGTLLFPEQQRGPRHTVPAGSGRGQAADGRAPILIAGPGCWSSPEHAIAAVSGYGFRVVVANEPDNIVHNSLINTGILPVCVAPEAIAELQDAVESDPGILLTVDLGRGDVRGRGDLVARFDIGRSARLRPEESAGRCEHPPQHARDGESEDLAGRLLLAQRLLGSADLASEARIRLQRRLTAICDAVKVPGADVARGAWRLDRLLAELARRTPGRC